MTFLAQTVILLLVAAAVREDVDLEEMSMFEVHAPDLYQVLGLQETATAADIKTAYRRLALANHPDRPGGDKEIFQLIQTAFSVLSDNEQREDYDKEKDFTGSAALESAYEMWKQRQGADTHEMPANSPEPARTSEVIPEASRPGDVIVSQEGSPVQVREDPQIGNGPDGLPMQVGLSDGRSDGHPMQLGLSGGSPTQVKHLPLETLPSRDTSLSTVPKPEPQSECGASSMAILEKLQESPESEAKYMEMGNICDSPGHQGCPICIQNKDMIDAWRTDPIVAAEIFCNTLPSPSGKKMGCGLGCKSRRPAGGGAICKPPMSMKVMQVSCHASCCQKPCLR